MDEFERLSQYLQDAKDLELLKRSLSFDESDFGLLQFYGNALIKYKMSKSVMRSNIRNMIQVRNYCISEENLSTVFSLLKIEDLINMESFSILDTPFKGSTVEAIIAELSENRCKELLKRMLHTIFKVGTEYKVENIADESEEEHVLFYTPNTDENSVTEYKDKGNNPSIISNSNLMGINKDTKLKM
eukprot:TRINITY_DN8999_c0_g1_i2.p1 TRINITY_DN8999_c0_g1~~TRINITY_DN8999_c0_g1_i2.p1  ORF type:complete len:187 (+),score=44.18 TRINITY_DN8999_c0_g1_i2:72-632(+)